MRIDERDRRIVQWAMERAYCFDYTRPNGLPDPCLRVRLGFCTAYFHGGKLVHLATDSPGAYLDQLLYEMASLFAACAATNAYVDPKVYISPPEKLSLRTG